MCDIENHMVLPVADDMAVEGEPTSDEEMERLARIDLIRDLTLAIRHLNRHQWFDSQDLQRLLKRALRYVENED